MRASISSTRQRSLVRPSSGTGIIACASQRLHFGDELRTRSPRGQDCPRHYKLQNLVKHSVAVASFVIALIISACTSQPEWNQEQKDVYAAMQQWTTAVGKQDGEAMWEMLSPDAQELYERQLKGVGGVRQVVAMDKAALAPDSLMSEEDKEKARKRLAQLPENPDEMTARDFYLWRIEDDFTTEKIENQVRLFDKSNVETIHVDGDKASVKLVHGDPDRYSWVRHDGVWKFDLHPSILRALETARVRENSNDRN